MEWNKVAPIEEFVVDGGECVTINGIHIAVFNMENKTKWFATQNTCPHNKASVLSRGIVGDASGEPKIVCPMHKAPFSLENGGYLGDSEVEDLQTYDVKEEGGFVFVKA